MSIWKHLKRGTLYSTLTRTAHFQWSARPDIEKALDGVDLCIYRHIDTGNYYVRPNDEFMDGRFEKVS